MADDRTELTGEAADTSAKGGQLDTVRVTRGLVDAGLALASALSLEQVLQVLVDVARELLEARYAALGVINAERTGLSDFITSGLTPEQRERMGRLPSGHGILGLLIRDKTPLRLDDLRRHEASVGFPPHHPAMRSFLGVPVGARDRIFGNLYVTEKLGAEEFSAEDLALVQVLAAQAAIAIENTQLRRERDRFFAAASHELGNAMAGLKVWSSLLTNSPPSTQEEWLDGMRKIATGAEQTSRLIEDLLSLSRIREGRLTLSPWPFDLVALANEVLELLRPEADAANVTLTLEGGDTPIGLEQDGARVRQILVNLVVNAMKFSPSGGTVRIEISRVGDGARIVVRDEGPGVRAADAERIFRPYEQISGVARGRGAGLGLPLSRQLAHLMGGELVVDVAAPHGLFRLDLPAEPQPRRDLRPARE